MVVGGYGMTVAGVEWLLGRCGMTVAGGNDGWRLRMTVGRE